jgi:hypothetical protein
MRKEAGFKPQDTIVISFNGSSGLSEVLRRNKEFLREVRAEKYSSKRELLGEFLEKEFAVDDQKLLIAIKKI